MPVPEKSNSLATRRKTRRKRGAIAIPQRTSQLAEFPELWRHSTE